MTRISSFLYVCCVMVFFISSLVTSSSWAQHAEQRISAGPDLIIPSGVTPYRTAADTGRMAWGHGDFTRYTAESCDYAVGNIAAYVWRARSLDTIPYRPATDTLPSVAADVARICLAKFPLSSISGANLWPMMRLALAANEDAIAAQVIERITAESNTLAEQAQIAVTAESTYLAAKRPRVEAAQALVYRLDSLIGEVAPGPAARRVIMARFRGGIHLLEYWMGVYDVDRIRAESTKLLTMFRAMPQNDQDEVVVTLPYNYMLSLANDTGDLVAQDSIILDAEADLRNWREGRGGPIVDLWRSRVALRRSIYGLQTKPFNGPNASTFWFNDGGRPHPVSGTTSLLVYVRGNCGTSCFPLYAILRTLKVRYGTALDIILLTETLGYGIGTGIVGAADEADIRARFYLELLQLPVTLLVEASIPRKAPNGRMERLPSTIGTMFNQWRDNMVLIDSLGKIRWHDFVEGATGLRRLETLLDRILPSQPLNPASPTRTTP